MPVLSKDKPALADSFDSMLVRPALPGFIGASGIEAHFFGWSNDQLDKAALDAVADKVHDKLKVDCDIASEWDGNKQTFSFRCRVWSYQHVRTIAQAFQHAFNELVAGHQLAVQ